MALFINVWCSADLGFFVDIHLISLCLQCIVQCPGLLQFLVQLVHLLLMLLFQQLPLLLELCDILQVTHFISDFNSNTDKYNQIGNSKCVHAEYCLQASVTRLPPSYLLMLFLQFFSSLLVLQSTALCILPLTLQLLLYLLQLLLSSWCLTHKHIRSFTYDDKKPCPKYQSYCLAISYKLERSNPKYLEMFISADQHMGRLCLNCTAD